MLRWKLTTKRHDGASEEFTEKHKAELGPEEIKEAEQHLAAQVGGGCARLWWGDGVNFLEVGGWGGGMGLGWGGGVAVVKFGVVGWEDGTGLWWVLWWIWGGVGGGKYPFVGEV